MLSAAGMGARLRGTSPCGKGHADGACWTVAVRFETLISESSQFDPGNHKYFKHIRF